MTSTIRRRDLDLHRVTIMIAAGRSESALVGTDSNSWMVIHRRLTKAAAHKSHRMEVRCSSGFAIHSAGAGRMHAHGVPPTTTTRFVSE
jgi:hypothetical protein